MDDPWFNAIFNEDFDNDNDNVTNHIVDHINYPSSCEGSGVPLLLMLEMKMMEMTTTTMTMTVMMMTMTVTMKVMVMVIFLRRQFDMKKLIICMTGAINMYYINYMHKEPRMVSYNTGMRWLNEVLRGHWK